MCKLDSVLTAQHCGVLHNFHVHGNATVRSLCIVELTCHCQQYINSESFLVNVTRRALAVFDQHVVVINIQLLSVSVDKPR
jgi:hypothetical protein